MGLRGDETLIDDFHFGRDVGDLRMNVDLGLLLQLQERQRDETLCDGSDAEHRVAGDIAVGCEVGLADAAGKHGTVLRNKGEAASWRVSAREHVSDCSSQLLDRPRLELGWRQGGDARIPPCR